MDKKNKVVKKPYDFYLKLPAPIVEAIFSPMTVIETLFKPTEDEKILLEFEH